VQKGKEVEIFNASPTPERYRFLDPDGSKIGFQTDGAGSPIIQPDLLIVLDTGTWSQLAGLAEYVRNSPARKVVIDHHQSQDDLGALRLLDTGAAACGMLVYEAFDQLHAQMTLQAAEALFVAITMDTGWLRHSNTSPEVYEACSRLLRVGVQPFEIYHHLFEQNSPQRYRLLGMMLERISLQAQGRLATSYVTQADIRESKAHPMDTEDFINYLMSLRGVESAVLFIEQKEGGTKVSFRSRGAMNCSQVAEQLGGGGHIPAAGATLALSLSEAQAQVLPLAESAMRN
jgi:phosphoesterase RecJ-like protein